MINTNYSAPALRATAAPAAQPAPAPPEHVDPVDTFPIDDSNLKPGGWAGINKPIKVADANGTIFVAKSNTLGAFAGLHPGHSARKENVHEIVASHIMADELHLPSLTFQEGYLVDGKDKIEKILSPFSTNFKTMEDASVDAIKDGDGAVKETITQGWLGDWDSTFNDSNVWVRDDGILMGSDYGYAMAPGIQTDGIPFANIKIMKKFGTKENITKTTDEIKSLTDEQIHGMVERQGSKWIHDWCPAMESEMSSALIKNRDSLKEKNPFMNYVKGFHPVLNSKLLKTKYPSFFYKSSKAQMPPLKRPDQLLDVFIAAGSYFHAGMLVKVLSKVREHVHTPANAQPAPTEQYPPVQK